IDGLESRASIEHAAAAGTEDIPRQFETAEPSGMQERGDGPLLIEAVFGGKSEDIDATKVAVGSLTNQLLDGRDATSVGRLPQHTEEGFAFAHCRELRLCDLDFIAHRSECLFAALPTRAAA